MALLERASTPSLIIICGRPGAGKTTMSRALSERLKRPLLSRDDIFESIGHSTSDTSKSAIQNAAKELAFETFFQAIEFFLLRKTSVIAEAAFRDDVWRSKLDLSLKIADVRIIQCHVDSRIASERLYRRNSMTASNKISLSARTSIESNTERLHLKGFSFLSLPCPTLSVDTTGIYIPAFDEIVSFASAGAAR